MDRAFTTAHLLDVPRLYMSSEVGFTRPRQAQHEWEQRERRKRLELMAEFKKASDRHSDVGESAFNGLLIAGSFLNGFSRTQARSKAAKWGFQTVPYSLGISHNLMDIQSGSVTPFLRAFRIIRIQANWLTDGEDMAVAASGSNQATQILGHTKYVIYPASTVLSGSPTSPLLNAPIFEKIR
ncbi:hypothetical protein DFH08DRAFT_817254 [Mycena albidolilacea]|uniref:Uncharacterized protein n=1 Tax=Mycena albidolilacea TaxID=1033008 RepID=A0AAD6ZIW8_9AGAR|nr:hypothetical protein DFH08DRAFT_817254 [Mycena albidolilacea]